jgi:flagellar motor component MotA
MDDKEKLPEITEVDPRIFTALGKALMSSFRKYNQKWYRAIIQEAREDLEKFEKETIADMEAEYDNSARTVQAKAMTDSSYQ